jgi:uncharacterized protein YbjT (DUF2867 family)
MKENMLVIGGTGKTGRKVVDMLEARGYPVRIGSRGAQPAFDWNEPEGWAAVLEGMDKMYVTFQPDLAVPGAQEAIKALVEQAKQSGIKKIVLLSGKGEVEAERCEQIVAQSGIAYSLVPASWFMQNFSESFFLDPIKAGHVALPKPEAKVPYVDTTDIAAVAVECLLSEKHNGHTYQLTGPTTLTFEEVVNEIANETGRDIAFSPITLEQYTAMLKEVGLPSDYAWLINYLFTEVLGTPGNNEITDDVEKVLGRKPKAFSTYVKETAPSGVWEAMVGQPM